MTWTASSLRAPTARKRTPARRRAHYPARARASWKFRPPAAVLQAYTADAGAGQAPQRYWRVRGEGLSWSAWAEAVAQDWIRTHRGAPQGIAALDGDGAVPAAQLLKPLRAHALPYMGPLPAEADLITTRCAVCTRWRPFPPPAPASISRWPRPGTWRCCRPRAGRPARVRRCASLSGAEFEQRVHALAGGRELDTVEEDRHHGRHQRSQRQLHDPCAAGGRGRGPEPLLPGRELLHLGRRRDDDGGSELPPAAPAAGVLYTAVASTGRVLQTVLLDAGPAARPSMYTRSGMARPAPGAHGESRAASAASPSCRRRMRARYM